MSYNSSAQIYLVNNTGGTANITLSHRYSDDSPQVHTWNSVPPGGTAGPLTVGFNTGFIRTGMDWWWVGLQVVDGAKAGYYASAGSADNPDKECMLESDDNGAALHFTANTETFVMELISGSCSTGVDKKSRNEALFAAANNGKKRH